MKLSGLQIGSMYNLKPVKGDVGIEIEVEGNKFPKHATRYNVAIDSHLIPPEWKYVRDGSLRGKDNAEYVLDGPVTFDRVKEVTDALWDMFSNYGTVLDDSNRTSVHVHLNVQEWHLNRLATFLAAYFSVEEILSEFCGEHRVGNLFCLRGKDAPGIISRLKDFIKSGEAYTFSDGMHYGGLNCQSIQKFGSLEIRTMRGAMKAEEVQTWVSILQRLYEISAEYEDPRHLVESFSSEGHHAYLQKLLGPNLGTILGNIGFDYQSVMEKLYEGIHLAQDIAYCRDWSGFKKLPLRPDPFGRKPSRILNYLSADSADVGPPIAAPTGYTLASFIANSSQANPVAEEYLVTDDDDDEGEYLPDFWEED